MSQNWLQIHDSRIHELVGDSAPRRLATGFIFTEGPVWDSPSNSLIFSDIFGDTIYRLKDQSVMPYRVHSNEANGNTQDHQGRLLTCEHSTGRVVREEKDGKMTVVAAHHSGRELNSPNDIIVDSTGRILFTDPPLGRRGPAPQRVRGVYAQDPDKLDNPRLLVEDLVLPNGLCLSPDESLLYVNDTANNQISRYSYNNGQVSGGETWAQVTGGAAGVADGMKTDSLGNVYCTGPGGVHIFDTQGVLLGVIRLPEVVANLCWGGTNGRELYFTASSSIYSMPVQVSRS